MDFLHVEYLFNLPQITQIKQMFGAEVKQFCVRINKKFVEL